MWLTGSDFMVMGLVSGLSLVSHSDSGSFLVARITQPRWIPARPVLEGHVDWHLLSPFGLS